MFNTKLFFRNTPLAIVAFIFSLSMTTCKQETNNTANQEVAEEQVKDSVNNGETIAITDSTDDTATTSGSTESNTSDEGDTTEEETEQETPTLNDDLLALEAEYLDMLEPIASLKESKPTTYWFIVSWLKTNYRTPDWTNYGTENWQKTAKNRGIDCSGFARIMHDDIFSNKIAGGSQGLLDNYCNQVPKNEAKMGDLVFFKAPNSESNRIVHVGVYLMDTYFVHATSTRSAAKGLGLKVDSLVDQRWDDELVAYGRVKDEFSASTD
jgi:cell wall-associated NlpC family hydrolase